MEERPPRRVMVWPQICCCVIGRNSCATVTSGPDEPICTSCVENGHPEDEAFRPVIKRGVHVYLDESGLTIRVDGMDEPPNNQLGV